MSVNFQPSTSQLDFRADGPAPPQKRPFKATHFSHSKIDGGVLRGALRGSTAESSDAHRVHLGKGAPAGVHVTRTGHIAHPSIKSRGFASGVSGDKAIADISGPERDVWGKAFKSAYQENVAAGFAPEMAKLMSLNSAENALKDGGWEGYEASKSQPGSVFLFGDQKIDG